MNKKDYIDAMNELQVSEKVKKETIHKISEKSTKTKYNKIYPLASLAIMCAVIMAIVLPNRTIAPGAKPEIKSGEYIEQIGNLPKVENFSNLYAMLKERANEGQRYYIYDDFLTNGMTEISASIATKNATADTTRTEQDYSKTNTQVEGVDEADIVKTDGRYIYYLKNDKLTIVDTNDNKLVLTSKLTFNDEFYPGEIYVKDNKLVVIGTEMYRRKTKKQSDKYYYPAYNEYTVAKIYNIEDKSNAKEERTVEIEGNYLSSRMIENNLYLISNKYNYNTWLCKEYEINELKEDDFKPEYIDTVVSENVKHVDFDCIYYIPESEDTSYLNIAALDITKNEPADVESYLGAGNQIYASTNNIYLTRTKNNYENRRQIETSTEIYKFELKDAKCTFKKNGTVPGTVLNQFSMDEKDGYFRIATTTYGWNSEDNVNNMYVLNENMETVGKVEGLAEGEKIYSVRFMGDRAYMVTFVQTDPLFVIDLSTPTEPKVLGELKIPGYSKYLHPYDETHLIGIGEDTKVVNYGYGDVVKTNGMKMALFDVTDPTNPKEMYSVKIGKEGTYSEVLNNHKALLFSKEKNIIAFPISLTSDEYEVTFQGAIVYGLNLDKGFELKGTISKYQQNEDSRYYNRANIERILYIQDTLYTLSRDLIKSTDMNTMQIQDSMSLR